MPQGIIGKAAKDSHGPAAVTTDESLIKDHWVKPGKVEACRMM